VHEAAVGDAPGQSRFMYVENAPAYSGLRERLYDRPDPVIKPLTVDVVRLDDAIPEGAQVDFIKLDIEAASSTP